MVLAAQALSKDADGLSISVDGQQRKGAFYKTYSQAALAEKPVSIYNDGANASRAVISVSGVPTISEPAADQSFKVERSYYTMKGQIIDPAKIKQNDRLIVSLKVTERQVKFGRLLLVDPLPAGLEIDNPNLVENATLPDAAWLKRDVEPANTEYRDDRFVAAFEREASQSATFSVAYIVRAVSPGKYVRPGAFIEDMYRPDRFGRTDTGIVEISAAR